VYQGLINDCYLTLLTLDFLRQRGPRGFLYTFEVDLRQAADDSPYCEIDVCAVVNGDLVIGEVKKGDKLERQRLPEEQCISRYHELAEGLGVRLAVFATAETAWSERTSEAINSVFRDSVVPVQQLTHSDLFAEPRSR
jgi:hypothetical protein